jgi:hypothetical protein
VGPAQHGDLLDLNQGSNFPDLPAQLLIPLPLGNFDVLGLFLFVVLLGSVEGALVLEEVVVVLLDGTWKRNFGDGLLVIGRLLWVEEADFELAFVHADLLLALDLLVLVEDAGLDLLPLPQPIHELEHIPDIHKIAERECPLFVAAARVVARDGILDLLHLLDGVDADGEPLADAEHVGVEAEVRLADVQPSEEDDGG